MCSGADVRHRRRSAAHPAAPVGLARGGRSPCSAGLGALAIIAAPVAISRPPSVRIAVVQTNIPQDNKMDWELEQRIPRL
jgi:apolipoprotein N-acyltransferase